MTGAALVVLGFVGFIVGGSIESLAGGWLALLTLLMVTIGFVVMWEALIAWPDDGSPYAWRRRLTGLGVGVATVASAVLARVVLSAILPNTWIAHTIALLAGVVAGDFALRRLRKAFSRHLRPADAAEAG